MPSIPQSLLWISLVAALDVVLVPNAHQQKRDAVRRTQRCGIRAWVLNGGVGSVWPQANRSAAGHRSEPEWNPAERFG